MIEVNAILATPKGAARPGSDTQAAAEGQGIFADLVQTARPRDGEAPTDGPAAQEAPLNGVRDLLQGAAETLRDEDMDPEEVDALLTRLAEEVATLLQGAPAASAELRRLLADVSGGAALADPSAIPEAEGPARDVMAALTRLAEGLAEGLAPAAADAGGAAPATGDGETEGAPMTDLAARLLQRIEAAPEEGPSLAREIGEARSPLAGNGEDRAAPAAQPAVASGVPAPGSPATGPAPAEALDPAEIPATGPRLGEAAPQATQSAPQTAPQTAATTSTAAPQAAALIRPDDLLGQIRAQVSPGGRIEVALRPDDLGGVQIELTPDEAGRLQVVVRADNADVLASLRSHRDALADVLSGAGVDLGQADLTFGDGQGQPQGIPPREGGDGYRLSPAADDPRTTPHLTGTGQVDLWL